MSFDIAAAVLTACTKLKESLTGNPLAPTPSQFALPAEVTNILGLPQRANPTIVRSLFSAVVGTVREPHAALSLLHAIRQTNPPHVPGTPEPQGYISDERMNAAYREAKNWHKHVNSNQRQRQREILERQRQNKERQEQQEEDRELLIDDSAGNDDEEQDIYESYRAAFITAKRHPDPIVETASLASVTPPKPTYTHHLQDLVKSAALSDAQLETIVYANMRFQQKIEGGATAGFFLGDGAGVGKGRQIAALIREHKLTGGRRTLWVSTSTDLRYDAGRDLEDVKAGNIPLYPPGHHPLPKGNLANPLPTGVLFVTYSLLVSGGARETRSRSRARPASNPGEEPEVDENPVDLHITKGSRLEQIVTWLKGDPKPLIILDECHKAKNLVASKGKCTQTGKAILKLQMHLPDAKVLYSSATGASEPNNLAYMVRLSACGFESMKDLVRELNDSGLGSLEMFSMGLKATGSYVSRALSYKGAEFSIARVTMDPVFKVMYNRSCQFWHLLYKILMTRKSRPKRIGSLFFAAQQRFYRQMLMAAKVQATAQLAREAVSEGMCVVIGLQSTGEANTQQARESQGDVMDDFVSAPRQVLQTLLEVHFPMDAGSLLPTQLNRLLTQVYIAVRQWKDILPAEEEVSRLSRQAAAAPSAAGNAANGSAAAASDSEDEITHVVTESLDERIQREREEEIRSGRFVVLDESDDAPAMREARAQMEAEHAAEAAEEAAEAQAAEQRVVDDMQAELVEAEKDVKEATRVLEEVEKELERCEEGGGSKRLRGKAPASNVAEDVFDLSSDDDDEPPVKHQRIDDSDDDSDFEPGVPRRGTTNHTSASVVILDNDEEVVSPAKKRADKQDATDSDSSEAADLDDDVDEDTCCVVCQRSDRGDQMLLCDACNAHGAHHIDCLDPPLSELPEGDWYCPKCAMEGTAAGSLPACVVCNGRESQDTMVTCPKCNDGPRHAACLQPASTCAPANYMCHRCTKAEEGRQARMFATSDKSRRTALKNKRLAAVKQLKVAQEAVKALKHTSDREARAVRRRATAPQVEQANGEGTPDSSPESEDDDDEDFDVKAEQPGPSSAQEQKPNVRRSRQYAHSTKRTEISDAWEDEVEAEGEQGRTQDDHPTMIRIRNLLLRVVKALELPPNPLDQLVDLLGGVDAVAEMTGRKGQLVPGDDGTINYQKRRDDVGSHKEVNMAEKLAFMNGSKLVAIISEAASTGISLQADKRVPNQKRRCHLTLELPWSADRAIQQFGRSHRSNQTSAPIYRIVVTDCAGEFRFAASAAKRLQSLGALLRGDRRALGAGQDLKEFDCDNRWGKAALRRVISDIKGDTSVMPEVAIPSVAPAGGPPSNLADPAHAFYEHMKPRMVEVGIATSSSESLWFPDENVIKSMSTWLNRVLAMEIEDQKLLFKYFSDTHDAVVAAAKSRGDFDHGITSLPANRVSLVQQTTIHTDRTGAETFHSVLNVDRGLPWQGALKQREEYLAEMRARGQPPSSVSGFYADTRKHGSLGLPYVLLATEHRRMFDSSGNRKFRIQRPNLVTSPAMTKFELQKTYQRINDDRAKQYWDKWFEISDTECSHGPKCVRKRSGNTCTSGIRVQQTHIISGAILPILKHLYQIMKKVTYDSDDNKKVTGAKILRAKLDTGEVIVGMEATPEDAMHFVAKLQAGDFDDPAAVAIDAAIGRMT